MSATDETRSGSPDAEREVAFFGRITASVTHELNNVLAIIEQNTGLLDDLVVGEKRGVPLSIERLTGVSTSIQKQAQRGLDLVSRLNRFAHTTDRSHISFDINEVVGNLVALCRRLATLKRLELEFRPAAGPLDVSGNPFALQQAAYLVLRDALEKAPVGTGIVIESYAMSGGAGVTIDYSAPNQPEANCVSSIVALMESMDATAEFGSCDERITVRLQLVAR